MPISTRTEQLLSRQRIDFHLLKHRPVRDLLDAAWLAGLPPTQVVRVERLLIDGQFALALFPCDRHLDLNAIAAQLGIKKAQLEQQRTGTGSDSRFATLADSNLLVDSLLLDQTYLYFEDTDPSELLRLNRQDFSRLLKNAQAFPLSTHQLH